jgi:hypothetical protein
MLEPLNANRDPWLVVFCDVTRLAFGACAYMRWQLEDGAFGVRFVAAKSRVAPLKELTIPRLELQAAVLASRDCTNNLLGQSCHTCMDSGTAANL